MPSATKPSRCSDARPTKIETIQPLRDGVIADFTAAEEMIKHFIRRVRRRGLFTGPRIMICVPASATPVERRAVHEAGLVGRRAARVYLIEEPIAAAIGAGLPIAEARGSMIVDIGGGTTDIAVLSMGSVLYSRSVRSAGNSFDEAIVNYVRFKYNLLIGATSAEAIKKQSGCAIAKVERRAHADPHQGPRSAARLPERDQPRARRHRRKP